MTRLETNFEESKSSILVPHQLLFNLHFLLKIAYNYSIEAMWFLVAFSCVVVAAQVSSSILRDILSIQFILVSWWSFTLFYIFYCHGR